MTVSSADLQRMGAALSFPGIDPRTWTTLAVVKAINTTDHGVYADVVTIAGVEECVSVAPIYAGKGFGMYAPIDVGSLVVVAFPEGDPNTGGRIIGVCWDRGTTPPSDVTAHPTDFVLVTKSGSSCRIVTQGAGDVVIEAKGSGKVKLGGDGASRGVARINDSILVDGPTLQANLDLRYAQIGSPAQITNVTGEITSASDEVKST